MIIIGVNDYYWLVDSFVFYDHSLLYLASRRRAEEKADVHGRSASRDDGGPICYCPGACLLRRRRIETTKYGDIDHVRWFLKPATGDPKVMIGLFLW